MSAVVLVVGLGLATCGRSSTVGGPGPTSPSTRSGSTTTTAVSITTAAGAMAKWRALHARSYRFHYTMQCFCPRYAGVVTVTDGAVTAWEADTSVPATPGWPGPTLDRLPTVDSLLKEAARAEHEATGKVTISYDSSTGAPRAASIDWLKDAVDDETGWTVRDLALTSS
jgi:Family of unknown function (DUF6174)